MAGRKPKPTQLKVLAGNPGKRKLNDAEPEMPVADAVPKPPAYLSAPAKKEWKRVAPILHKSRILTEGDYAALEAYCAQYGVMVEAQRAMKKNKGIMLTDKSGLVTGIHPAFDAQQKAMTQMRQFMVEFGLTPSSRSRIKVAPTKKQDDFSEFD